MENFNIISKKENPLFKRNEVKVGIHAKVTPSNNEVEKLIYSVTKFEGSDTDYYDSVSIGKAADLFLSPIKPKPKRK